MTLRDPLDGGIEWPRALLVALAVALAVALVIVAATSSAAFGLYNPSWDGASGFHDQVESDSSVESELVRDTARYETVAANDTTAFVVAPTEPYTESEAVRLREFVERGGTLVVMENFGPHANPLLESIGAEARVDGRLIRDERHYHRAPTMPVATEAANHTLTANVTQMTLNYATSVEPGNATALVSTSDFAYLDAEDDGLAEDDVLASRPVATVESLGSGRVVVVGDPSIAINSMRDEPDNDAFLRGLYADEERVVFDISHADDVPPLAGALLTVRGTPFLQALLGALAVGTVAALSRRGVRPALDRLRRRLPPAVATRLPGRTALDRPERPTMTDAERAALLRRRHPDWDDDRIQRVIAATKRADEVRNDE